MSLNALQPFIKVEDPTVAAFERASSEQISKEFKEELEGRQKASEEGVALEEAPSISLRREDVLGYGLDSLVKGLSADALKKKRKEEAKQRSKYTSYAGNIFPETPVANLNALEQGSIAATELGDSATITERQRLEEISFTDDKISLEEGGGGGGRPPESLSWIERQLRDAQNALGPAKQAYGIGKDIESALEPPLIRDPPAFQMSTEANLSALNYSGSYGAEYAASLASTGQVIAAHAFDASKGIWGGMGTKTGLAPFHAPATGEMIAANVSKYAPYVLKGAALYMTFKGGIPQTTEGKVDAAISTYAIFTGHPAAVAYGVFKGLVGYIKSRKGKPKFAKGGADIGFEGNYFKASDGYGYNGYSRHSGQAGSAAVSDYLNTFKDYFGLKFYKPAWEKAVAENPRMGRYENINQSGYADPTVLIRSILEIPGFIQGSPSMNGESIQSQEQYEAAMAKFNEHYKEKAMERGGLYDAKKAGIHELSKDGVPTEIWERYSTGVPDESAGRDYHGRWNSYIMDTRSIGKVDNPYDMLYYNLVGRFNRGSGGSNY